MPVTRTFRVFVSSTFSDLKAERNAMQREVFPELRRLCEKHGTRFQPIDLRWGVSEEAALDQQAMKICLSEIGRCQAVSPRPNFIILLGNRYGWRPLPYEIPAEEFQRLHARLVDPGCALVNEWYVRDENAVPPVYALQKRTGKWADAAAWAAVEAQLHAALETAARQAKFSDAELIKYHTSATEQEIINGAIEAVEAREHIFCFTRETSAIPLDETARDFIDLVNGSADGQAATHLLDLKKRLKSVLGSNYHEYPAQWQDGAPSLGHLEQFCRDIHDRLAGIILSEIEHPHAPAARRAEAVHIRVDADLDAEGLAQHQFAEERIRFFVGRREMLAKISAHLQAGERRPLAVTGGGGTGKSALMAKAVEQAQQVKPQAAVIYRFIGATPVSSDGRSLLEGLCRQLARRYGQAEAEVPTDYRDLVPELGKRMALATAAKPLILFLDSLDQLSANQNARSLVWLPNELPEHVSLILSSRENEDTYESLRSKHALLETLGGLSRVDGDDLLSLWLADRALPRTLQPAQRNEVLNQFDASSGNPLYLKLAYEEAGLWRSGSGSAPEALAPGVSGIIEKNMLDRLKSEANHGESLVAHALGYLAAARYGLAEDELVDLLSRDVDVYAWFFQKSYHLPSDLVTCARLYGSPEKGPAGGEEQAALAWLNGLRQRPEELHAFLADVLPRKDGPRLPVVLWSRLSFDLAPYLTEFLVDGSPLLNFYHRELGDVSRAVFLKDGQEQVFHERLAQYFRAKADPAGEHAWDGHHLHALSELPWHLTRAGRQEELYQVLTDFNFLEHKAGEVGIILGKDVNSSEVITSNGVGQMQEDFERALAALPGAEGGAGGRPPLILTAIETSQGLKIICPVCNTTSPVDAGMKGTEIRCPQAACRAALRLNPFTVKREL